MADSIRLLVCDIDGTLVRQDKSLSDAVRAAGQRVIEAGVPLALISARPPSGIGWLAKELGSDSPLAAFNGGTLFRSNGDILIDWQVPRQIADTVLPMLSRPDVTPWVFARGRWFVADPGNPHVAGERIASRQDPVVRDNFADLLPAIDKMVAVSDVSGALDAVEAEVRSAAGHAVTILRSQPYYLDVTHTQANKGDGVIALADLIGVPLSATAAIGDMDNDLPMFAQAGLSIAMGQAPDAVKAAADHVTTSNEEDGVAHAIETYILPAIVKG